MWGWCASIPVTLRHRLSYDAPCGAWIAPPPLAPSRLGVNSPPTTRAARVAKLFPRFWPALPLERAGSEKQGFRSRAPRTAKAHGADVPYPGPRFTCQNTGGRFWQVVHATPAQPSTLNPQPSTLDYRPDASDRPRTTDNGQCAQRIPSRKSLRLSRHLLKENT